MEKDDALNAVRRAGFRPRQILGSGVEGVVLDVGHEQVVKLWHHASPASLERLQAFYAALAESGPALRTPLILRVESLEGRSFTVEQRLHGQPLQPDTGADRLLITDAETEVVLDVLGALAGIRPGPALAALPTLPGEPPLQSPYGFGPALADLVERRTSRFHQPLRQAVPELDRLVVGVTSSLRAGHACDALIHGDLISANILIAPDLPPALIDFGCLTMVGDPAFDAAVAASIFDMYGRHAHDSERLLDAALAERFGYDETRRWVYRAAYALITSNCFTTSGSDGHFAWCAAMLNRSELRTAIGV